ncbi:MAG TPA: hypothetical protein DD638_08725, partial [Pasteurellaceae bacterium]|nr:hypothetical protein [Pasteurellaceae bacterium]
MKRVLNITFSALLLLFFSGSNIGRANEKTIKHVYVIDLAGAEIKKQASESGKTLATYPYGKQLAVIEETNEWLGIRERVTRESVQNSNQIESTGWEKAYVLKSKTGAFDEITLVPEILPIISWLGVNKKIERSEACKAGKADAVCEMGKTYEKYEFFETEQALKDFLEIE